MSLAEIGGMSERRTFRLLSPFLSELPPYLTRHSGLNNGYMLAQYTAAALVAESRILCHPASVDSSDLRRSGRSREHGHDGGAQAGGCAGQHEDDPGHRGSVCRAGYRPARAAAARAWAPGAGARSCAASPRLWSATVTSLRRSPPRRRPSPPASSRPLRARCSRQATLWRAASHPALEVSVHL